MNEEEKAAKLQAAAEARAARAAAKAAAEAEQQAAEPKAPSPNQPLLDEAVALISGQIGPAAIEEAYINELNHDMPLVIIRGPYWLETAQLLRNHPAMQLNYLRNVSGVDYESYMEVVYHLLSLETRRNYTFKVKVDRDAPELPSVTAIWPTANWNEREIYDLLGIAFLGHPDLRRIMMPDDWVGYPLRKDYEPLDSEV